MDQPTPAPFTFEMTADMERGAYANLGLISYRDTEFTLDFFYMQPQLPKAKGAARVVTSALHAKRLLAALADNVAKYEAAYGEIRDSNPPKFDRPASGPMS